MKNVDEALDFHIADLEERMYRPNNLVDPKNQTQVVSAKADATTGSTIPRLEEKMYQQLLEDLERRILDAPPRRRRGRPFTLDMNESFHAFLFVYREQGVFKKRNGDVKRVPEKVTDALIDFAKNTWYPNAKKRRIRELLRMRKKYI